MLVLPVPQFGLVLNDTEPSFFLMVTLKPTVPLEVTVLVAGDT